MDFHVSKFQNALKHDIGEAQGFLGGLQLDEIDAANWFLMLSMAREASNGQLRPVKSH